MQSKRPSFLFLFCFVAVVVLALKAVDAAEGPIVKGKWFDRIIIFTFENHAFDEVVQDPNFSKFSSLGVQLTNYFAVTHPSQPNYWCQTSGDYYGINSDTNHDLDKTNIVDLLDAHKVSWKAYMEDFPGHCFPDAHDENEKYYRKHNPFMSYDNIRENATRCSRIVNSVELDWDLGNGTLPQYMYFTPNIDNDCHNTNIAYGGRWLNSFLTPRLAKFPKGTLFVITWDEDDYTESNQICTSIFGSMIPPNKQDNNRYDHFSLLRTVEDNWNLGTLGRNDDSAVAFALSNY